MYQNIGTASNRIVSLGLIFALICGVVVTPARAEDGAGAADRAAASETVRVPEEFHALPSGVRDPVVLAEQGSQPVSGGTSSVPASPAQKKSEVPSLASYGKEFFPDLWDGTKRIFSPDVGTVALIGVGVTGLSFAFDHSVDDYFQNHQPLKNEKTGDKIGQGYVPFGLGVALFATGQIIDDKKLADTGAVSVEALAVTGIATEALKYLTRRERPNHVDNMSFPSGHASMTAAFAASVSEMYDWTPWLAVPLYAVTAFVGASRIQAGEHHFSDVVAGITLGTVVGMGMGRSRKDKNAAESRLSVSPFYDGTSRGVMFSWRF